VVCSVDGRTLFVANAAYGDYGLLAGRGAISKVAIDDAGQLSIENARFIAGLNAPVGVALLPAPVAHLPEGALAVVVGGSWTVDTKGNKVEPADAGTGVAFFETAGGTALGRIFIGRGSPMTGILGHPVLDPAAITADGRGNIYIADVAGARMAAQRAEGVPGMIKLSADAVGALLRDEAPPSGSVSFVRVENVPTGIAYSLEEDALYYVTGNGIGVLGGAIFRLPQGDFSGAVGVETSAKELNSLVGVTFSPGGKVIAGRNEGDLVYYTGRGRARPIKMRPHDFRFLSPGQPAMVRTAAGSVILVVPELSGGGIGPWRQRLQVVDLPGDF
jgi:hypothetical protein